MSKCTFDQQIRICSLGKIEDCLADAAAVSINSLFMRGYTPNP